MPEGSGSGGGGKVAAHMIFKRDASLEDIFGDELVQRGGSALDKAIWELYQKKSPAPRFAYHEGGACAHHDRLAPYCSTHRY